ncbi:hypothetical protein FPOAC2_09563 [Fusarium poae]|jgi:hypothetical protein
MDRQRTLILTCLVEWVDTEFTQIIFKVIMLHTHKTQYYIVVASLFHFRLLQFHVFNLQLKRYWKSDLYLHIHTKDWLVTSTPFEYSDRDRLVDVQANCHCQKCQARGLA